MYFSKNNFHIRKDGCYDFTSQHFQDFRKGIIALCFFEEPTIECPAGIAFSNTYIPDKVWYNKPFSASGIIVGGNLKCL